MSESTLRWWFAEKLILPDLTRNLVHQGDHETAGLNNEAVKKLDEQHLIRQEPRGGSVWYELAHDRFINPIVQSNTAWLRANDTKALALQQLAAMWEAGKRHPRFLLTRETLQLATKWLASTGTSGLGASRLVRDFIAASEKNEAAQRGRRLARTYSIPILVLLIGIALLWKLYVDARKAEKHAMHLKEELAFSNYAERGSFAAYLADQSETRISRQYDALVWAIRAAGGPLRNHSALPSQALEGLRKAVSLIGDGILLTGRDLSIESLHWSYDDSRIVAVSEQEISVWDVSGKLLWQKTPPEKDMLWKSAVFTSHSKLVFVTLEPKERASLPKEPQAPVSETPTQRYQLIDSDTGNPNLEFNEQLRRAEDAWISSSAAFVVVYAGETATIIDLITKTVTKVAGIDPVRAIQISADGRRFVHLNQNGRIRVWSIPAGELLLDLTLPKTKLVLPIVVCNRDGSKLAVGDRLFSSAQLIDVATRQILPVGKDQIRPWGFTPDSKYLIALMADKNDATIPSVIDPNTGLIVRTTDLSIITRGFIDRERTHVLFFKQQKTPTTVLEIADLITGERRQFATIRLVLNAQIDSNQGLTEIAVFDNDNIGRIINFRRPATDFSQVSATDLLEIAFRQLDTLQKSLAKSSNVAKPDKELDETRDWLRKTVANTRSTAQ